jgi:hypothetical protein
MSRHRSSRLSVDLFPFLSIIVCVIGVISFLIAVLALVGSEQGDREKEYKEIQALLAERNAAIDRRKGSLEQEAALSQEIERIKDEIQAAEAAIAEIRRLAEEVSTLRRQMEDLIARREELKAIRELQLKEEQRKKELEDLAQELGLLQTRLKNAKKVAAASFGEPGGEVVQVVFPAAGNNGQKPVFVECSAKGLTVFPDKTFISKDEVARGVAYREVLDRIKDDGKLALNFLVRPDGIKVFDAAREIARNRSVPHGYVPAPGTGRIVISGQESRKE